MYENNFNFRIIVRCLIQLKICVPTYILILYNSEYNLNINVATLENVSECTHNNTILFINFTRLNCFHTVFVLFHTYLVVLMFSLKQMLRN